MEEEEEEKPSEKKFVWESELQPDSELLDLGEGSSDYCDAVTNFPRDNEDSSTSEKPRDDLVVETVNFSADDSHQNNLPLPRRLQLEREPKEKEKVREMLLEDAEPSQLLDKLKRVEEGEDELIDNLNKLASLGYASSKLRPTHLLTHSLTGVKCRATSVAKNHRYV